MRVDFPLGVAIGLPQHVAQLLLSYGRRANVAHAEGEVSLMVGGYVYHYLNLLSLPVRLSDGSRRVLSGMGIKSFTRP